MAYDGRYENGNPPYTLYQDEDGLWGLIDKDGAMLPAVFKRLDEERFQEEPWSVVMFNPEEGFELLAWSDPCEVWFNFTFDDSRYPAEFAEYLWKKPNKEYQDYKCEIRRFIPAESHWLLDCLEESEWLLDICDDEHPEAIERFLNNYPQLANAADFNHLLDPIMLNANVSEDIKTVLWQTKVMLDANVRQFLDEAQK